MCLAIEGVLYYNYHACINITTENMNIITHITNCLISRQSIPVPKATVAHTTTISRLGPLLYWTALIQYACRLCSLLLDRLGLSNIL